jgi:hypothetical protein
MKRVAALLALIWCIPNLVVAYWMVQGAFIAKTAMHEGILAQASLLLGGLLIALFTALLGRLALRMLGAPDTASA